MQLPPIRVVHVTPSLDIAYGGPAQSVPALSQALRGLQVDSTIYTVRGRREPDNDLLKAGAIHHRSFFGANKKMEYFSPALRAALGKVSGAVIHVHQILTYPALAGFQVSRQPGHRAPLVCSLRSDLYEESLQRSAWKKKLAMKLVLRRMLSHASCLHATESSEVDAVRRLGLATPVALVSNGIDVSQFLDKPARSVAKVALGLEQGRRYALFLSRLHPRKGLHHLIEAFIGLAPRYPDWDLLVAGPDHDPAYVSGLKERVESAGLSRRVVFTGLLGGRRKVEAYAAAEVFALPSEFENFGMAIAESFAAGCPVITTDRTPWPQIEALGCGWRVPPGRDGAATALQAALSLPVQELDAMGRRAQPMLAPLSWDASAEKMKQVYEWVTAAKQRPDHVYI